MNEDEEGAGSNPTTPTRPNNELAKKIGMVFAAQHQVEPLVSK